MAKKKKRRNPDTCYCAAYPFPHHYGRGPCHRRTPLKGTKATKRQMGKRNRRARREGRFLPVGG